MQKKLLRKAESYARENRGRQIWRKFVQAMACVVVFCTTYALILPAITMEKNPCDLEEHTHGESCYEKVVSDPVTMLACTYETLGVHVHTSDCYDGEKRLLCGQADYLIHEHNEDCLDENGTIVCQLPEASAHVHTDDCYRIVGTEPVATESVHTHGDDCYGTERGELICQVAETEGHSHGENCFTLGKLVCQLTEQEGHTHGTACYESLLTCELSEEPAHQHTDACYEMLSVLICGLEDGAILTASTDTTEPERELICTEPVAQVHTHGDSCYVSTEEDPLTCTLPADENHTHSAICYGTWELICGKEEHTHDLLCQNDPEADVETEADWIATFADVTLTGEWDEDLLSIARSQLGYQESTRNYEVMEDGETIKGYTRYGDWYGMPYGDWCAMFVSFCLNYAEIPQNAIPYEANCPGWIEALQNPDYDLYQPAGEYTPVPGDLIFFDWEEDGTADHVGIVTEIIPATEEEPAKIKTIEGDMGDRVAEQEYDMDDVVILGYAKLPEKPPAYYCGLQEHIHGESCTDVNGELVCGLEEHTHSVACTLPRELNGADEIPLTKPLICTMEEHSHDSLCYGETVDGGLICDRIEHTHTSECYGPAVAVFSYEDDYISMDVTVTSYMGLPEEMSMEVLMLNTEDQHYTAYEGYAVENANGELLDLTGYQVRFFYEGQEIRLEDAEITAELTVKPVEYQAFVKSEDTESIEIFAEGLSKLFAEDSGSEEPALMSLSAEETAAVLLSSEESENGAEDGETPESVIITVLQQSEDEIISHGSTTFSETENQSTQITLSLTGNTTFALAREGVANPEFTVQYYANFPKMLYLEDEPTDGTYYLDVIDTRGNGDGSGGSLPKNGAGNDNPGTTNGVMYLQLRQIPGQTDTQMHSSLGGTAVGKNVCEVYTKLEQAQVYKDYPLTYVSGLGIEHMDKLQVNTHYNLVDLWISSDNGETWTVYTTVPLGAVEGYSPDTDETVTITDGVDPYTSLNEGVIGQWYHGLNTGVNDHLWFRKYRQNAGDVYTIAIPHKGNVTHIVRVNDIRDITFTNNSENTDAILIEDNNILRLVYDLPRNDQSLDANFFDYDISDTNVYVSATTSTEETPVLETGYIYSNVNDATYDLNLDWEPFSTFNDRLYMKTSDIVDDVYVAYGINSTEAYLEDASASAYFAFGNQNTGVFRRKDVLDGYYINCSNDNSFKGCSFGLAKGLINGQPFLELADGIARQALFNEEAIYGSGVPGKTTYSRQQLVFRRMGDTYILTGVKAQGNGIYEEKLNQFIAPGYKWNADPTIQEIQFTNNFWPLDGTVGDTVKGHDMMFGGIGEAKDRWFVGTGDGGYSYFPNSDDGQPHNSYFGMAFSVEFQLEGEYCGPMEYLFFGDDDMWVFLTNIETGETQQICDIGGVHGSVGSYTDLWDYISKDEKGTYRLDFFYTERGATGSTCYMAFTLPNMASIPQIVPETGTVRVKKEVPNATVNEEFTFKFELTDYTGNEQFGTSHTDQNGKLTGGTIKNGESFKLKAGETMSITGIPKGLHYQITEQLDEGQKFNVTWKMQGVSAVDDSNTASGTVENGITHTYICTNEALGSLEVEKTVKGITEEDIASLGAFVIDVTLTDAQGNPLTGKIGSYEFDQSGKTTVELKHGNKALFTDIPVGTVFTVQERLTDGYSVSYMLGGDMVSGEDGLAATSVSGTIQYNKTASIEVVNTTGYELPQTGGAGKTTYTMVGLVLTIVSAAYLLYRSKARRRGVF